MPIWTWRSIAPFAPGSPNSLELSSRNVVIPIAMDARELPAGVQISSFVRRERVQLAGGIVRDVLVRKRQAGRDP